MSTQLRIVVLGISLLLVSCAGVFGWRVYAEHKREVEAAEQQRRVAAAAEQERIGLEQQRVIDENNRRYAEEQKAEQEQQEAKKRHDYGMGFNLLISYKGIQGISIFTTNWETHRDPPLSLADYKQMDQGNNRLLVWWAKEGAAYSAEQMATIFTNSPQAGEDGIQDMGFDEVQFVDPTNYCYASVNALLGLSGMKCQPR